MRRIGVLLTIAVLAVIMLAAPAAAAEPNDHASDAAFNQVSTGESDSRATANQQTDTTTNQQTDTTTQSTSTTNSGNGMNRQGGASTHPGNGWTDPGQDQGSETNVADPDCTGNRTNSPQATNIGACDAPTLGAADKPVASPTGGFDADRDWNNGCGNDVDFEDDNNGQCTGPPTPPLVVTETPPKPPTPPTPPTPPKPPSGPVISSEDVERPSPPAPAPPAPAPPAPAPPAPAPPAPPEVLGGGFPEAVGPAPPAAPQPLPVTGMPVGDLTRIGLGLVAAGTALVATRRRKRW